MDTEKQGVPHHQMCIALENESASQSAVSMKLTGHKKLATDIK